MIRTQIISRLKWYLTDRGNQTPAPCWYYNDSGEWVTDPQEIIRLIRLDDELGIENEANEK